MFRRFSNPFDTLLTVQQALDAARRSDYFEYHTSNKGGYPYFTLPHSALGQGGVGI